jgi:hypothetical protein
LFSPELIILLKVALNNINPTIQTTKNYSVNWNGNHQKRDEIDTKSHSFFFIYKILNGCNGLRPAYLYEFVQPCLTRKPGHNLRNENNTFHLPFSSTIMIILFLSLLDYAILYPYIEQNIQAFISLEIE